MKTKTFLLLTLAFCSVLPVYSPSSFGPLSGQIIDSASGAPIELANVVIFQNGNQIAGSSTDADGYYSISPIKLGKYDIGATHMSYKQYMMAELLISGSKITKFDIVLSKGDYTAPLVEIPVFRKVLIDQDVGGGIVLTGEELKKAPISDFVEILDLTPGVLNGSIQANRPESMVYIVDGMKIRGDLAVQMSTIQEMRVLIGGIPAEYGDILGGVVVIETKNPLNIYSQFDHSRSKSRKESK